MVICIVYAGKSRLPRHPLLRMKPLMAAGCALHAGSCKPAHPYAHDVFAERRRRFGVGRLAPSRRFFRWKASGTSEMIRTGNRPWAVWKCSVLAPPAFNDMYFHTNVIADRGAGTTACVRFWVTASWILMSSCRRYGGGRCHGGKVESRRQRPYSLFARAAQRKEPPRPTLMQKVVGDRQAHGACQFTCT